MHARQTWTPADIERLPEDERFELLNGEPLPVSPTGFEHLFVTNRLNKRLTIWVDDHDLGVVGGEGGFLLPGDDGAMLAPDIVFVAKHRLPRRSEWAGFLALAPDLAVEVVSPGDTVSEVNGKTLAYLDAGVRAVWLVDPRRRIVTIHTPDGLARMLREGDELTGGDVLPGFAMPVAELFAWDE